MSERADEERRRDALKRLIINAIQYGGKEWDITQRDVIFALKDTLDCVAELFIRGNKDANKKLPKKDDEPKDE